MKSELRVTVEHEPEGLINEFFQMRPTDYIRIKGKNKVIVNIEGIMEFDFDKGTSLITLQEKKDTKTKRKAAAKKRRKSKA